mmetsp:Transcript_17200/g.26611  ORF Transcript_17200/g.26611 Transcript_17200/m.26611 type:complete len:100 (+) Transcript_17200:1392-1691(+)
MALVLRRMVHRGVKNHEDVLERIRTRLSSHSIAVHYGNETLRHQFELFVNSHLVIGPHGAGFTNLIVSPPGSLVLEFGLPHPYTNLCFFFLSVRLEHRS